LAQITIVLAKSPNGDAAADERIEAMADPDGSPPLIVLTRENGCYSYGSWEHAYLTFREEFSHYIFVEDDYIPCHDNFDTELVDIVERKQTHVCSLTAWWNTHAAISNAICTKEVLENVMPTSYADDAATRPHAVSGYHSQLMWSWTFYDRGYEILDWTDTHASPFWNGHEIRWYGHPALPCMFVPMHAIERQISIADGVAGRLAATMSIDGTVRPITEKDQAVWDEFLARGRNDSRWRFPGLQSKPAWWKERK